MRREEKAVWPTTINRQSLSGSTGAMETHPSCIMYQGGTEILLVQLMSLYKPATSEMARANTTYSYRYFSMILCVVGTWHMGGQVQYTGGGGGGANIPARWGTVCAVGGPVAAGGGPVGHRNIVQVALLNTPLLILLAAFKQYHPNIQ